MPSIQETEVSNHIDNKTLFTAFLADITAIRSTLAGLLTGSVTWDVGSLIAGATESKDITVTGAVIGDFCMVSMGIDIVDMTISAQVTAADVVTITIANTTAGTVNLASTTARAVVFSKTTFVAPAALTVTA